MSRVRVYSLFLVATILAVPQVDAQADSGARAMHGAGTRAGVGTAPQSSSITSVVVPDSSGTRDVKTNAVGPIAVSAGEVLPLDIGDATRARKLKASSLGLISEIVPGALPSSGTYESSCTAVVLVCPALLENHTSATNSGHAGVLNILVGKLFGMRSRNSGIR